MPARDTKSFSYFFCDTILAWGHISRLGGTSNDLVEGDGLETPPPPPVAPGLHSVGLVAVVDIVSIVDLVGMVVVVGLVDMLSKYSRKSRQGRHNLAWDNKTLILLCLLEQLVFHFVYIAFTTK